MSKIKVCAKCGYLEEQCTCDKQETKTKANFLLSTEMLMSLVQMADMQYKVYNRFLALTDGDIQVAEQQTYIFMKALNSGSRRAEGEE